MVLNTLINSNSAFAIRSLDLKSKTSKIGCKSFQSKAITYTHIKFILVKTACVTGVETMSETLKMNSPAFKF